MNNIINLAEFRKKLDFKIKTKARVKQLRDNLQRKKERAINLARGYKKEPPARILDKITTLEDRHNYDIYFINLMDQFMAECYPDYRWKFSDWLDKNDK